MKKIIHLAVAFGVSSFLMVALANADIKGAFGGAQWSGKLRTYNNYLNFYGATKDRYGTAFGTQMGFLTKSDELAGFSLGLKYYGANDLQTNKEDTAERAPFTPTVDVDTLGEAYLKYTLGQTKAIFGRQMLVTPFANPADAFVVPVLFTGYSVYSTPVEKLSVQVHHMNRVKTREAQDFANIGVFSASRFGGTVQETAGMSIAGVSYGEAVLNGQVWYYSLADIMDMAYARVNYTMSGLESMTPYFNIQYGSQSDNGDKILGTIDSTLTSVKAGVKLGKLDISLASDVVSDNTWRSPFAYFTDTLFCNSMITGMSNIDDGNCFKLMLLYNVTDQLWTKLSHAQFNFENDMKMSGSDFDVRYKFSGSLEGFQIWERLSYRKRSDDVAGGLPELMELRTQLEYVF